MVKVRGLGLEEEVKVSFRGLALKDQGHGRGKGQSWSARVRR